MLKKFALALCTTIVCTSGSLAAYAASVEGPQTESPSDTPYATGMKYLLGKDVARNVPKAAEWFEIAAANGDANAQYQLGVIYYNGGAYYKVQGIPQDYPRALDLFNRSAAQGNLDSQYNAGVMYQLGQGTPKDMQHAFDAFSAAAEHDVANAQLHLAGMYFFGDGVPQDYVKAYMWAVLADEIDASKLKGNATIANISHSAPIEKKMSSEQISEGKKAVAEWLSKHPGSRDSGFR